MKHIMVVVDGMPGEPLQELGGKTPLEAANTPCMDWLLSHGIGGGAYMGGDGLMPGSDVGHQLLLGYSPKEVQQGRGPLEAMGKGYTFLKGSTTYRCNIVTCEGETLVDYTGKGVSSEQGEKIVWQGNKFLEENALPGKFYPLESHQSLLVVKEKSVEKTRPPYEMMGKTLTKHKWESPVIATLMEKGRTLCENANLPRGRLWFWGGAAYKSFIPFLEKTGVNGAIVTGTNVVKGIGIAAGMAVLTDPSFTGTIHTSYQTKWQKATSWLKEKTHDFVLIHLESTDGLSHQGNGFGKKEAIQQIDQKLVMPLKKELDRWNEDYKIMIVSDHMTLVTTGEHKEGPVPYLLFDSRKQVKHFQKFQESVVDTGQVLPGEMLLYQLLKT